MQKAGYNAAKMIYSTLHNHCKMQFCTTLKHFAIVKCCWLL